jgi:xylulokinase
VVRKVSVPHVIAVDQGTTGIKVGRVDVATGAVAWSGAAELTTDFGPDGAATQDAEQWWALTKDLVRRAATGDVVAVACTGMWSSTVPVDADGAPVGPARTWYDTRGRGHTRAVIGGPVAGFNPNAALRWLRKTGAAPSASGGDPIGHMLHLQAEGSTARWFLEPVDLLNMRFTGIAAASHASMTGAWLTDNRRLDVLDYDDDLVRRAGVDRGRLPPLVRTGDVVGTVKPDVAADLGLPPTARVVTGLPDLHSATVGVGAVGLFEAHLAISTSAWIGVPVPFKKTDITHQIASIPGLRPGEYLVANNHETAGRCLQWLRDALFPMSSYDDVVALAARSPAGARGVLFAPWLLGERSPVEDRRARAGFHNVGIDVTGADLARAVLEGVAMNARWLHEHVERFCKRTLDPIRIFGGGAVSDLWCQIHADVLDRTIERVAAPRDAGLRGAALFAALSLGLTGWDDVATLAPVERVFAPDPANRSTYDRLFAEYPGLYTSQRKMFRRLN